MTDLSDAIAEQPSNVIEWNGAPGYGLFEFDDIPAISKWGSEFFI